MSDRDARRRFRRRERAALLLAAGGCCSECGAPLTPDFHADHREPWARGGRTDVINGQALCPPCNCRKGANPAVTTTPAMGSNQAVNDLTAAGVADGREQHHPARAFDPAVAGDDTAHERYQEIR